MNSPLNDDRPTVVAGFGSPHGDDQAGWRLAAMLQQRTHFPARVIAVIEATELFESLQGCQRLIIVDACHSGRKPGSITQLRWPDSRIGARHGQSTHGLGVADTLRLAKELDCLPMVVDVIGIEIADCTPARAISSAVLHAVVKLEARIAKELCEVAHA